MKRTYIFSAFYLSLGVVIGAAITRDHENAIARYVFDCPAQDDSELSLEITGFAFGQMDTQPGDIPPRLSSAQVAFTVTNPQGQRQACSSTIVKQQDGVWQDADGSLWFKCGSSSTQYQFGWGHADWRLTVKQTWTCDSTSYEVSGSTVLDPECTPSENEYFSCSAPDFSLSVA
ncbi:hypothetical protein F4821DRAFT_275620 [Hypoxylon rubiginosum]|uniref:Uncharacterized protein n=1 Tax=Hypoxylon rubiginosum TaxID=110542 RepID=A0ACC0CKH7_9PEZI|nr:hypothetical protein F4821DRAFT_275620 [Hypoxylon rubiginosum]